MFCAIMPEAHTWSSCPPTTMSGPRNFSTSMRAFTAAAGLAARPSVLKAAHLHVASDAIAVELFREPDVRNEWQRLAVERERRARARLDTGTPAFPHDVARHVRDDRRDPLEPARRDQRELRALRAADQRDAGSIDFGPLLQPLERGVESIDGNIRERSRQLGNLALAGARRIIRKPEHGEASRREAR